MTPDQITGLQATRDSRATAPLTLQSSPLPDDDGTKKAKQAIKERAYEVAGLEKMIEQHDAPLASANPKPTLEPAAEVAVPWVQQGTTIASIPKGRRAEVRVSVNEWKGLRTIDVRLWYIPKSGGEWGPSRKGVNFEAGKVGALLEALHLAKLHVVEGGAIEG